MKSKTLYVDMDGVLADFGLAIKEITGSAPEDLSREEVDTAIELGYSDGGAFFRNLTLMPDAIGLWAFIQKYNPIILTSIGDKKISVMEEKIDWAKKHFPGTLVVCVNHSYQKSFYAHKDAILIDDRMKSIDPWVKEGGIGILHSSARETIKQFCGMHMEGLIRL